ERLGAPTQNPPVRGSGPFHHSPESERGTGSIQPALPQIPQTSAFGFQGHQLRLLGKLRLGDLLDYLGGKIHCLSTRAAPPTKDKVISTPEKMTTYLNQFIPIHIR